MPFSLPSIQGIKPAKPASLVSLNSLDLNQEFDYNILSNSVCRRCINLIPEPGWIECGSNIQGSYDENRNPGGWTWNPSERGNCGQTEADGGNRRQAHPVAHSENLFISRY